MKKTIFLLMASFLAICACDRQESMNQIADRVYALAASQFKLMASELEDGQCPRSVEDGCLQVTDIGGWCSGFFPGSLWLTYEHTGDPELLPLADRFTRQLDGLTGYESDHDLGFRVNCSYGNAYRITGDESYLPMIDTAAVMLAARFNPVVGCTRSWNDRQRWDFPVIIDNMMNLELLMNATSLFSGADYKQLAETHANTTLANHFREDWSTWHLLNYSSEDGHVIGRQTVQGFSDSSMWARGESWALYGYTMMYRETGVPAYLDAACNIADLLLKRLPEDGIPYWDFDCDRIPDTNRDASAACIMASAFLELSGLSGREEYRTMAELQIRTLTSPEYLSQPGENHGFLLKHSVGNFPGDSEVDVPLTYADYYLLEALSRL